MPKQGHIYLICMEDKIAHSRHYVGFSTVVDRRIECHLRGRGQSFTRYACQIGNKMTVTRLWEGTGHDERKLKNLRNAPQFCPRCAAEKGSKPRTPRHLSDSEVKVRNVLDVYTQEVDDNGKQKPLSKILFSA